LGLYWSFATVVHQADTFLILITQTGIPWILKAGFNIQVLFLVSDWLLFWFGGVMQDG
jgi:hypothetical protein